MRLDGGIHVDGGRGVPEGRGLIMVSLQARDEETVVYFYEKMALTENLFLDFEEVRELVILGVRSPELRSALIAQMHRDKEDLLEAIRRTERMTVASRWTDR